MADQNLVPEKRLLKLIFPDSRCSKILVIRSDRNTCICKLQLTSGSEEHPPSYVVRLEVVREKSRDFGVIATIQQIAATAIPEYVPQILKVGKVEYPQGRTIQFSAAEYIEGSLLEDIWPQLDTNNQKAVVTDLVEALNRLSTIKMTDAWAHEALSQATSEPLDSLGGPHTGFLVDGMSLLQAYLQRRRVRTDFCSLSLDNDGIEVRSRYREFGCINVHDTEMEQWPKEAVLCHNDLNPSNLILRPQATPDGILSYRLAAIIDWELAGFYPLSFQLSLQDVYLGCANRHTSFYLLLKKHMKNHVPRTSSQIALVQAMDLIYESQQKRLFNGANLGAGIRKRFIQRSRLIKSNDPYNGWVRESPVPAPDLLKSEYQELVNGVDAEMVRARISGKSPLEFP